MLPGNTRSSMIAPISGSYSYLLRLPTGTSTTTLTTLGASSPIGRPSKSTSILLAPPCSRFIKSGLLTNELYSLYGECRNILSPGILEKSRAKVPNLSKASSTKLLVVAEDTSSYRSTTRLSISANRCEVDGKAQYFRQRLGC